MYSFPNLEPVYFVMSGSNCCFLTCIQISQEAGKVVWYSYLSKNLNLLWSTVKGFDIVNKAEVYAFLELPCFFYAPTDAGNLISCSFAFSTSSLNIWKFLVHILLKPHLENFQHYLACMWDECNCVVVWKFFCIAFLWDWNENWPFPVLWSLLSFPHLLAYRVHHFNLIIILGFSSFSSVQPLSHVWFFVLQNTRLLCPSPTPRACSNSCPSSPWWHPTISSSVIPFSSCLQSFPASGSFPVSQFFPSGGQSIGVSASASVLPYCLSVLFLIIYS